ncbi:extracellular catalytic domain type 1 short-chain-length polyhydroxyalkanoate depolymerase [Cryptosporangium aurantiacum]|uniref:Polyhydroxybutyrate depolymerase n=1 Tax=Cryptosporangium aurantiacum TaxID=134849 RepID=A0A1M7PSN6_9ACTN|nr:PHB depolymerase family esterase [Cryptosporangium aurantiacum]SHN20462.1 polyhydroxybutyrate depolymerase [Cryptosporangium aurantiacum]
MRSIAVVLLLVLTLAGCGRDEPTDDARGYTVRVGDVERTYQVHVPAAVEGRTGVPAVIVLHGGGGNGSQVAEQTGFSALADREGFLAVYPDGSGRTSLKTWNAGTCCSYARDHDVDDVGFVRTLIDALTERFGAGRVYVTGFSNGAMLSYRLGCELADRITAIAPVSGALNVPSCEPARPLPVYTIHGDADDVVPYTGGTSKSRIASEERAGSHRSVTDAVEFWTRTDRCAGEPVRTTRGAITTVRYTGCAAGTEVRLDTVAGGGHAWPGGDAVRRGADRPTTELDATAEIWDFFRAHES